MARKIMQGLNSILGGSGGSGAGMTDEERAKLDSALLHLEDKNNPHEVELQQLKDISFVSLLDGQVLTYKDGEWVNEFGATPYSLVTTAEIDALF